MLNLIIIINVIYQRFSIQQTEISHSISRILQAVCPETFYVLSYYHGWQNAAELWLPSSLSGMSRRLMTWANVQVISVSLAPPGSTFELLPDTSPISRRLSPGKKSDINQQWLAAMLPLSTLVMAPQGVCRLWSAGRSVVVDFIVI